MPGSPDWDELFIEPGSIFQNGEPTYFSEDSARPIWQSGLTLRAWDFEDIRLSQYGMHQWYAQNNERPKFLALQRAISQVEKGISASYGYQFRGDEADPLLDGMSSVVTWLEVEADTGGFDGRVEYDKAQWQEVVTRAEERFLRLSSLPADLVIGDNHEPYKRAVQNARQLLFLTGEAVSNFDLEGVDVSLLKKGYAPEFTPQTSANELIAVVLDYKGSFKELSGGKFFVYDPISKDLYGKTKRISSSYDTLLVGGYFFTTDTRDCHNQIGILHLGPGPKFEETFRRIQLENPCRSGEYYAPYYSWHLANTGQNGIAETDPWYPEADGMENELLSIVIPRASLEDFNRLQESKGASARVYVPQNYYIASRFPSENGLVLCIKKSFDGSCDTAHFFDIDLNLKKSLTFE